MACPNASIAEKVIPDRKLKHGFEQLQPVEAASFEFIKLELNSYIGNPK